MGCYYLVACEDLREFIDPRLVGGGANKFNAMIDGPCANLVAFAMMTRWRKKLVRYVGDETDGDDYYVIRGERWTLKDGPRWQDVTKLLLKEMADD